MRRYAENAIKSCLTVILILGATYSLVATVDRGEMIEQAIVVCKWKLRHYLRIIQRSVDRSNNEAHNLSVF
jgi:hypothetical protein